MKNTRHNPGTPAIAWFVSPHGFGHAARAAAIIETIHSINPSIHFDIFTTVPEFFLNESLPNITFNYHHLQTDIGLAQKSALHMDIPETIRRLETLLPYNKKLLEDLAGSMKKQNCRLAVCDIAPMGIAAAKTAGIPSILVENFTWDWIYGEYETDYPAISPFIAYLKEHFDSADFHIRTEPAFHNEYRNPDITVPPMSRKPRLGRKKTRERLNIPEQTKTVVITMGGIPDQLPFLRLLPQYKDIRFIVPGSPAFKEENNVIRLPYDSDFYHPDLMAAADAVIGKPGYSTLAEVYHAGVPFGFVSRGYFRESAIMERFIKNEMSGFPIPENEYRDGTWLSHLHKLLQIPRIQRTSSGTSQVARFILKHASGGPLAGGSYMRTN